MAKKVTVSTRASLGWVAGVDPIPGYTKAVEFTTENGRGWKAQKVTPSGGSAPTNVIAPSFSGDVRQGETVTAVRGTWASQGATWYSYRWLAGGVAIDGATGLTYVPTAADVAKSLTFEVTATNPDGSTTLATSGQTVALPYVATIAAGDKIAAIGNSTVAGISTGGGTAQVSGSWPTQLAALLTTSGLTATAQNRFGTGSGSWSALLAMDERVGGTGAFTQTASIVPGGNGFGINSPAAAGTGTFNMGVCNKIAVYWINNTAGRIMDYSVDNGGPSGQLTTSGVYRLERTVIDVPLGQHSITFSQNAMHFVITGVEAYDDTSGMPVRVFNLGISGANSTQMVDNSDTGAGRLAGYTYLAPKLSIIEGGIINDWRSTTVTVAQSKANLVTLVRNQKAAGATVVLMTPVYDSSTGAQVAIQEQFVAAMREVAVEEGVAIIDVRAHFQSWAYANAQGWMSDTVHPSAAGYAVIAQLVFNVLRRP